MKPESKQQQPAKGAAKTGKQHAIKVVNLAGRGQAAVNPLDPRDPTEPRDCGRGDV